MTHAAHRPALGEYDPFYQGYVALVPAGDVRSLLAEQQQIFRRLSVAVPRDRETFRYAPGKWSIREVAGHLGDAERVFGHRAFCISRGEQASLPGFDENAYVARSASDQRPLAELVDELALLREVNLRLLASLDAARWGLSGVANGAPVSVRALAWVLAGHAAHHLGILRDRYGVEV
jgi:hypothetical protein